MYYDIPKAKTKTQHREVLSKFKGVDAASPVYAVDKARATAMRNFIAENGSNHKRPGWRQIARFKDAQGHDQAINGYFRFTISLQEYRIVYAGTTFYIYDNETDDYVNLASVMTSNGSTTNAYDPSRLIDRPVQMFVYGERAFFVGCGDFLVFEQKDGKPELRRVQDDAIAYIPRTTTNIAPNEVERDENDQIIAYGERQTDRDVNVLCKWRYNELIGSAQADASDFRTYTLDTDDIDPAGVEVTCYDYAPVYSEDEDPEIIGYEKVEHTFTRGSATAEWLSATATTDRAPVVGDDLGGKTLEFNTSISSFGTLRPNLSSSTRTLLSTPNLRVYLDGGSNWDYVYIKVAITNSGTTTTTTIGHASRSSWLVRYTATWDADAISGLGALAAGIGTVTNASGCGVLGIHVDGLPALTYELKEGNTVWGYIDFPSGKVAFKKPIRPVQGEANIKIKFAKTDNAPAARILGCTFGAYFGTSGNANTLFLSGNAEVPNMDFWSEAEDFAYFPSGNMCAVGTPNTAIKAYMRLGDDSLAILKEESRHEPTLYVRTGVAPTANTDNVVTAGYYYTRGKFITQGAVSSWACGMLAGDPLFLSDDGVFGIVMTDNVAVEQRIARERSRFINTLLAKHRDLSKATAIVHDNRYYLAIDGAVYIADARYTHTARGDMPDTYNYEWWCWDGCPVRQWYVIDGALCFGTNDGRLCVFDKEFTDRKYEKIGAVTPDFNNNEIAYNTTAIALASGDLCYLKGNAYRLYIDNATVANGAISFPDALLDKIHTGTVLYADTVGSSGLAVNTKYVIDSIDMAEGTFTLATENGAAVTPTAGGFRLLCAIDGEIVKAEVDDNDYLQLKNVETGELYAIAIYNSTAWSVQLCKYIRTNVVAEWYSPVMDMGANDYIKTLMRLTIATEQITNGRITFGWETKSVSSLVDVDARGLDVFDFGNLNFARFAFDTGFSSSYTRDVKADYNFILFRFISDNDCDCCVYSFTVTYKVNHRNKGVF